MLILLLCSLLAQETTAFTPDTVNAVIYVDGQGKDVVDIRIKGVQPYAFEFRADDGETNIINIFNISRISKVPDSRDYRILFLSGEEKQGRISSISFTGNRNEDDSQMDIFQIHRVERVHFMQGKQLRSCEQGHYEDYTPYPYCPMCGNALALGPYEQLEEARQVSPNNALRLDGRDPANTAIRRY